MDVMDRKRQDQQTVHKKTYGEDKEKNDALVKLRNMEWRRNQEDPHYLHRPSNDGGGRGDGLQERKKYNQDEDNYFEGTGGRSERNRKVRKPRHSDTLPTHKPAVLSSNPPPVNAWSQKKGSALFEKAPEPEDLHDDELLRLVYEQSKITAAQDEERRLKKYQGYTYNEAFEEKSEPRTSRGYSDDIEWEDEHEGGRAYSSEPPFSSKKQDELHFVDTDLLDDVRETTKKPSFTSKPTRNSNLKQSIHVNNVHTQQTAGKFPVPSVVGDAKRVLPSYSKDAHAEKKNTATSVLTNSVHPSYFKETHEKNNTTSSVFTNSEYHNKSSINNISNSFASSLTFGDTKEVMESIQENSIGKPINRNYQNDLHKYTLNKDDSSAQAKYQNASPVNDKYLESLETDKFLALHIRRESPSTEMQRSEQTLMFAASPENIEQSSDIFSMPNQNDPKASLMPQEQLMNYCKNTGAHRPHSLSSDTSYSPSDSPLQSDTPYGSLERHSSPNHIFYPANFQNNHPHQHHAVHNMNHQAYPHPAFMAPNNMLQQNIFPLNPQAPGYGLPSSNFPRPSLQSQAAYSYLYQAYIHEQQMMLQRQNALLAAQQPAEEEEDCDESEAKSNDTQSVPQSTDSTPKVDSIPIEVQPLATQQNVTTSKSREEIQKEMNEALQRLNQLQKELDGSPAAPLASRSKAYPYMPTMGVGNIYPGMPMMSQVQQMMPQTMQSEQLSPDSPSVQNPIPVHGIPNMPQNPTPVHGIPNMYGANLPGLPDGQLMNNSPGFPQGSEMMPNTSAVPNVANIPNLSLKQNSSVMPQIPMSAMMYRYGLANVPGMMNGTIASGVNIPVASNVAAASNVVPIQNLSGIPSAPVAQSVPGVPNTSGMSNVLHGVPNLLGMSGIPMAQHFQGVGNVTGSYDVPTASTTPAVSKTSGIPFAQNMNEILARMMTTSTTGDNSGLWERRGMDPNVPAMNLFGIPQHQLDGQHDNGQQTAEEQGRGHGRVQQQ